MFNINKNKVSHKEILAVIDKHSNMLDCLLDICKLQVNASRLNELTIVEILKQLKFDSREEWENFFQTLNTICDESKREILEEETEEIEDEMDSLCGLWRTSSQRTDSAILISKLPEKEYVFTYHPVGNQNDSYSSIIENIIDEPTSLIINGEDMSIHYEGETKENQETIFFDKMLYFRTSRF